MFKRFCRVLAKTYYFLLGNLFAMIFYERKYMKSKHFKDKLWGVMSPGWQWVVTDAISRIFLGINITVPFPVSPGISVGNSKNIYFDIDDLNNFQTIGSYYQALGAKIIIGKGTYIAPNVGLITTNHDVNDPDLHVEGEDIILGDKCWIGMNSVILPGVTLGPHTTVGAGSVVTKSFPEGYCIIAGNPAKKIKDIQYS